MNPFRRVLATEDQQATMAGLNAKCASLYADIEANVPEGPYKSEALLKLTIVGMLASKGITHGSR